MSGYRAAPSQPRLVVISPQRLRNTVYVLGAGRCVLGRAEGSQLRVDDPHISRTHAALDSRQDGRVVEDLGSTGGTFVNGRRVDGVQYVRHGDMLRFGAVEARYEETPDHGDQTMVGGAAVPAERVDSAPAGTRFEVGPQGASTINNVGGSQYNHVVHQRESFLREIAATRTRARRLVQFGLVLFLVGLGVAMVGAFRYAGAVGNTVNSFPSLGDQSAQPDASAFGGFDFSGFQVAMVGGAIANLGVVLMLVGLVMHIVAASRRRKVYDRFG
jgi:pSer/pThr/pTyr-binding forkhead associated (FHA) protein